MTTGLSLPFLSVVMPLHGGADLIGATLDSLVVEPTEGIEFIVIDSSPDDTTADIIRRYPERLPLQLMRRPDIKPWQTKTNMGVELAKAAHVCILHHDDLWLPGRVASIRRWIANWPDAAVHFAPTQLIDREGRVAGKWTCPLPSERPLETQLIAQRLLVQNFASVPAMVFRRDSWMACGGMDEELWYTPDWDIWLKLASGGTAVYHDEITTAFRLSGGSLTVTGSRDIADFKAQMETVVDRHLDLVAVRKRAAVERAARASIDVNVALASALRGSFNGLGTAVLRLLLLGPVGISRFLRDSRLNERVLSRLRAKRRAAF